MVRPASDVSNLSTGETYIIKSEGCIFFLSLFPSAYRATGPGIPALKCVYFFNGPVLCSLLRLKQVALEHHSPTHCQSEQICWSVFVGDVVFVVLQGFSADYRCFGFILIYSVRCTGFHLAWPLPSCSSSLMGSTFLCSWLRHGYDAEMNLRHSLVMTNYLENNKCFKQYLKTQLCVYVPVFIYISHKSIASSLTFQEPSNLCSLFCFILLLSVSVITQSHDVFLRFILFPAPSLCP